MTEEVISIPLPIRASAILLWITGGGFGIPCVLAIRNLAAGKGIPYLMGFPAYGGGPFERYGIFTTIPLLAGFLLVCIVECVAGWLLWDGHKSGAIVGLALLPAGLIYWWGFALPFGPILAVARTLLIIVAWRNLS